MKKAFEKFKQAQQYIAERNYDALTAMLIKTKGHCFQFTLVNLDDINIFEKITNYMITSEINCVILTNPDFTSDEDFIQLCNNTNNNTVSADDNFLPFNCTYFIMNRIKKENRIYTIRLSLKKFQGLFNSHLITSDYMEKVVWYAAFEEDDELLEEIYNLAENEVDYLDSSNCLHSWMWMYLQVIIDKNRYDLLDKTIKLIYKKNNYNFTEITNSVFSSMSYSEFIFLLYRRYAPETSDSQIIEKLLDSSYFRIFRCIPTNTMVKNELEYLSKFSFKTQNANSLFELWVLSKCKYEKEYLYSFLDENAILFINNMWIDIYSGEKEYFDFLKEMLTDNPDISVSIDPEYEFINFNITQLKKIFSIRKPILTGNVKDNKCIVYLIKTKSKKLKTLLEAIEIDDKTRDGLIEICIQHKNIPALNIISNHSKEKK